MKTSLSRADLQKIAHATKTKHKDKERKPSLERYFLSDFEIFILVNHLTKSLKQNSANKEQNVEAN